MSQIPKRIFFFWGGSKMSWLRYMTLYSFRKLHPDWDIYLYVYQTEKNKSKTWITPEVQDFFMYKGEDYISKVKKLGIIIIKEYVPLIKNATPSQQSNFFKWWVLGNVGGVYSDMDILYFKNINGLYTDIIKNDRDTALTYNKYYSIGFMMASKNNEVFKAIYDNTVKIFMSKYYQGAGVIPLSKKWPRYYDLEKAFPEYQFYNIPMDSFYYLDSNNLPKIFKETNFDALKNISLGLHWYAGGRLAQECNNRINLDNYKLEKNTVSEVLEQILK